MARTAGWISLLVAAIALGAAPTGRPPSASSGGAGRGRTSPARAPQPFEEERGQSGGGAAFLTRGDGYAAAFDRDGLTLALPKTGAPREADRLRLTFLGGGAVEPPAGIERLQGVVHYLTGEDRSAWITGVPTFGAIRYSEILPGIDLTVRGDFRRLALDFAVGTGADAGRIGLALDGAVPEDRAVAGGDAGDGAIFLAAGGARLRVTPHPGVTIDTAAGLLTLGGPAAAPGEARVLHLTVERVAGAGAGAAAGADGQARVALDGEGHLYLSGGALTASFAPAEAGTRPAPFAVAGAFVSRRDHDAITPRYTTYFGAAGDDRPAALSVGEDHEPVVTSSGTTRFAADGAAILARAPEGGASEGRAPEAAARTAPARRPASEALADIPGADRAIAPGITDVAFDADGHPVVAGFERAILRQGRRLYEPAPAGGMLFAAPLADAAPGPEAAGCPGTIQFDNSAGTGLWQTATNWDLDRLPTSTDDTCIPSPFSVSMGTGALPINTVYVASGASLALLSGGSLSIAAASQVEGNLNMSLGTITGAGTLDISSLLNWTSGAMTGAGTVNANGGISLNGTAVKDLTSSRVLNTSGTVTWTGTGPLRVGSGGTIHNAGTWDAQSNASLLTLAGSGMLFENQSAAIFKKTSGNGTTSIGIAFDNAGTVDVQNGIIDLGNGGTSSGAFQGSLSTTLRFTGGTHTLGSTSSLNVPTVSITGGSVDVSGAYTAGATTVSIGTLAFNPAANLLSLGTSLSVTNGTVTLGSGEAIALGTLTHSGGTIQGGDTVSVSGAYNWSAGALTGAGTVNANAGVTLSGSGVKDLTQARVLNVSGTSTWTGTGTIRIGSGAVIHNAGTWTAQNDSTFSTLPGAAPLFDNQAGGIFRKSGTAGVTTVGVPFDNHGSVDVVTGTLNLDSGGTASGPFTGAAGATLQFGGGTHTLGAGASVNATTVSVTGGTIDISCPYTASTSTSVSVGDVTFNPAATLASLGSGLSIANGSLTLNSGEPIALGTLTLTGGTVLGSDSIAVSGLTTWNAGIVSGSGTLDANGGITYSTAAVKDVTGSRTLNAAGTIHWTGGGIRIGGTATIRNSGTWQSESDGTMTTLTAGVRFENRPGATFRKTAGTGSTSLNVVFDSDGTVEVQSGTLSIGNGGTGTGSFAGLAGTTLDFDGGTYTLAGASTVAVPNVSVSNGAAVAVNGTYAATSSTSMNIGTLTFYPVSTVTTLGSAVNISLGTMTLNSGELITPVTLTMTGGVLGGSDEVRVSGLMSWSAGEMTGGGTTRANGGITISSTAVKDLTVGRQLVTPGGTVAWSGTGLIRLGAGATIHNEGATWQAQSDATIGALGAGGSFVNHAAGVFRKTGGTGSTSIDVAFDNDGLVEVQSGTIDLGGGGTTSGTINGSAGTTLRFSDGAYLLAGTSSVAVPDLSIVGGTTPAVHGSLNVTQSTSVSFGTLTLFPDANVVDLGGALSVASGTLDLSSGEPIDVTTLNLTGGTITGSDTLSVSGLTTWSGGVLSGSGDVVAGGGMTISSSAVKDLSGTRRLVSPGTTTWTGSGAIRLPQGAVLRNLGTWDAQSDAGMTRLGLSGGLFENAVGALYRKTAGAGTSSFQVGFSNAGIVSGQSGTVSLAGGYSQSAGSTLAQGGTISSATSLDIQAGLIGGTSTISASIGNAGSLSPGVAAPGSLTLDGALTQWAASTFDVEIGGLTPGTQHDRAVVSGSATLAGTLNVSLVNGFVPADHDQFTVMTFASSTGEFTAFNYPALPDGMTWKYIHNPTSIVLEAMADLDGDGVSNLIDCAPNDATAWAVPAEVGGVALSLDGQSLSWGTLAVQAGPGTVYDVMRGQIGQWPVGNGAAETCLGSDTAALSIVDGTTPAVGTGLYYLTRGVNVCGIGTYGNRSDGTPRVTPICP